MTKHVKRDNWYVLSHIYTFTLQEAWHFPLCLQLARFPSTLLIPMSYNICLPQNIEPEAEVTFISIVTASIKDTDDKYSHMAISETAVLLSALFISAVVIAVTSLGPDCGGEIRGVASSLWVQPLASHSHKTDLVWTVVGQHGHLYCQVLLSMWISYTAWLLIFRPKLVEKRHRPQRRLMSD